MKVSPESQAPLLWRSLGVSKLAGQGTGWKSTPKTFHSFIDFPIIVNIGWFPKMGLSSNSPHHPMFSTAFPWDPPAIYSYSPCQPRRRASATDASGEWRAWHPDVGSQIGPKEHRKRLKRSEESMWRPEEKHRDLLFVLFFQDFLKTLTGGSCHNWHRRSGSKTSKRRWQKSPMTSSHGSLDPNGEPTGATNWVSQMIAKMLENHGRGYHPSNQTWCFRWLGWSEWTDFCPQNFE